MRKISSRREQHDAVLIEPSIQYSLPFSTIAP